MKPPVVILAAGASERLGECKALVDLAGSSALARILGQAWLASAEEIHVVAGPHRAEIERELARIDPARRVLVHFNADWSAGRTGSVALAASRLPGRALLVAPIDVPLVGSEVFRALFQAWEEAADPPRGWLAPCVQPGRFGHPLVLGRELARDLVGADPAVALRRARDQAQPRWSVAVSDRAILDDLDTPADLARMRERLAKA